MGSYALPSTRQIPSLATLLRLSFSFPRYFFCFLARSFFPALTFSSLFIVPLSFSRGRISTEHSPKLQIRSHSYLRAVSEVSINRSLDSLDPAGLLASPKFRSRNESYMRAMSTISQVSGHPGACASLTWGLLHPPVPPLLCPIRLCRGEEIPSVAVLRPELTIRSPSGKV